MKLYESSEDYLERILILSKTKEKVISLDIAKSMNFSKPSVSRAVNNLRENGYLEIASDGTITLTEEGYAVASKIYERHELLTKFFIHLGVDPKTAQLDACKVEHDLSDETFEAIKRHGKIKE